MRLSEAMVRAAAEVRLRQYGSEYNIEHLSWRDFADESREILEAALLAEFRCGARTDGEAFTGKPGRVECVKLTGHSGAHRSAEGAAW